MRTVSNNGQCAANTSAQSNTARSGHSNNAAPTGGVFSVAEVAEMLGLKEQPNGKFCGAPEGTGKTKDGFILNPGGNAFTNDGTKYTSRQVAELAGISPDQYAPVVEYRAGKSAAAPSRPVAPKAAQNAPKSPGNGTGDNDKIVSPEARGLTPETLVFFGVERIQAKAENRNGWKYPTFHTNENQGRTRFKNARPKSKTEQKYQWWKGGDNREPDGYNLQNVPEGAPDVWIVGGEPDVWMMHQNGLCATATFGETSGAAKLVAALKSKSVARVHIALDADDAGLKGAQELARQCIAQGLDYTDRVFQGARGHDVCDEFARAGRDREKFVAAMESLPERVVTPAEGEVFETFTFADMMNEPRTAWLIRGILKERTISVLSADSGGFKSFFALEMALCIATGTPFFGREVKRGTVVYVAAEGYEELLDRARAWSQERGVSLPANFHVIKAPVNLADAKAKAKIVNTIQKLDPVFLALDTLSQNALGIEENSNTAMAMFTAGMAEVGSALGAHVQVIHHNSKAGGFRGAGSIKGNVDTHITLERPEGDQTNTVFVRCEKQRSKKFTPFALRGEEVEVEGAFDEYGDAITSLVFQVTGNDDIPEAKHPNAKRADKTRARLLEVFDEVAVQNPEGVKIGLWKVAVEEAEPPICAEASFWSYRKKIEADGEIAQCGNQNGSPLFRRVNPTPTTPTTPNWSSQSSGTKPPKTYSNNSNNPLGVGVVGVGAGSAGSRSSGGAKKRVQNNAASEPYGATPNDANEAAGVDF